MWENSIFFLLRTTSDMCQDDFWVTIMWALDFLKKSTYGATQMSFGNRSLSISLFWGHLYSQSLRSNLSGHFSVSQFISAIFINEKPTKPIISKLISGFWQTFAFPWFSYPSVKDFDIFLFIYTNLYVFCKRREMCLTPAGAYGYIDHSQQVAEVS